MAVIGPFKGIHYNFKKIPDLSRVIVPPYDIISERGREHFLEQHPYNFVRLIKGEKNFYPKAASNFQLWLRETILLKDVSPAIYCYRQEFVIEGEEGTVHREGIVALVRLDEEAILRHEAIMPDPAEDREALLAACKANLSPIFSVYPDPEQIVRSIAEPVLRKEPFIAVSDNLKVRHLVWRISSSKSIAKIEELLRSKQIYIVDGHHRLAAAMRYRDRLRQQGELTSFHPANFMMMFLCPIEDEGLRVFPIHRAYFNAKKCEPLAFLEKLKTYFEVQFLADGSKFLAAMREAGRDTIGFKIAGDLHYHLAKLQNQGAVSRIYPPVILHELIFRKILKISEEDEMQQKCIHYIKGLERDVQMALRDLAEGKTQVLFFLPPPKVTDIVEFAERNEVMPQKSTYFFPKIVAGLLVNDLRDEVVLNANEATGSLNQRDIQSPS